MSKAKRAKEYAEGVRMAMVIFERHVKETRAELEHLLKYAEGQAVTLAKCETISLESDTPDLGWPGHVTEK